MNYTTAPLPFLGQKKDFAGRFSDAISCFTGIPSPFRNAVRMSRSGGIRDIRITDLMLFRN